MEINAAAIEVLQHRTDVTSDPVLRRERQRFVDSLRKKFYIPNAERVDFSDFYVSLERSRKSLAAVKASVDNLEKSHRPFAAAQVATAGRRDIRANRADEVPTMDTRRGTFRPEAIVQGEVKPGESGLQAALVRMRQESEDAKLRNTQSEWTPANPLHPDGRANVEDMRGPDPHVEKMKKEQEFIVKVGESSLQCKKCAVTFWRKQFGPTPFQQAQEHLRRFHADQRIPGDAGETFGSSEILKVMRVENRLVGKDAERAVALAKGAFVEN